ncbi:hypothetical protein B0H10DRAFT_2227708 [Mycena sp. CBHHK59/15]|nr:hypothetical protein B0H10DRAFT_2227708 [Mycena sp. CBHHK59/15]
MASISPTAKRTSPLHLVGLSTNYSMAQQGFTADISCSFQNLTNETTPDLQIVTDTVANWTWLNATDNPVTWSQFETSCPWSSSYLVNFTSTYTTPDMDYLMLLACNPGNNYTLIILPSGTYDWLPSTICTMVPKISTVNVDYVATVKAERDPDGIAGSERSRRHVCIYTIYDMVNIAQAIASNPVGIQWMSLNSQPNWNDEKTLRMIEQYFKGVTEYSASVLRACLSGKNATFLDGVPSNMSIATSGILRTETLGWAYVSGTTQWVLLPGTFIAFATVVLVLVVLHRHAGDIPHD